MKTRYYAYYGVPGEWAIMSADEHKENLERPYDERDEGTEEYQPFETLKEAKTYVRRHLQGDIADCRSQLSRVNAYRKGES